MILIPAYQPNEELIKLVKNLRKLRSTQRIIIVDDGSDAKKAPIFLRLGELNIELLRHPENRGKGQALKTGFEHCLKTNDSAAYGVITADADGQHLATDILRLSDICMQNPSHLYLGVRQFNDICVPWRSRWGNKLTTFLLRLFMKMRLQDTQTGLRAVPRKLMQILLHSKTSGYDFEFEMLFTAKKHHILIQQMSIRTVYMEGNNHSHFNPWLDSIKIYFVFIRFAIRPWSPAVIDFVVFTLVYAIKKKILFAVLTGHIVSTSLNFKLNHHSAFKREGKLLVMLFKNMALAILLAVIVYNLILLFHNFGMGVYSSKLVADVTLLFLFFVLKRVFIFKRL